LGIHRGNGKASTPALQRQWLLGTQPQRNEKKGATQKHGMGNKIARTTQVSASEYYLHDLPSSYNLVLKEVLGRGRFLKSILCKHDEGLVLVKVYFKRGDSIDLREYERRLFQIREIFRLLDNPHVWPFQVQFLSNSSSLSFFFFLF